MGGSPQDRQPEDRQPIEESVAGPPADVLARLAEAAADCRRCPLYRDATQVVFGEGDPAAELMLVGEQPGDREDMAGRPFVGPAGALLDRALTTAGVDRRKVFLTNAVKHFKHEPRGKRRIHKKPDRYEIDRCRWWLDRELAVVRPKVVVALGVTAASSLAGRPVVLSRERGDPVTFAGGYEGIVTIHPSAVLRARDEEARASMLEGLADDLSLARRLLG